MPKNKKKSKEAEVITAVGQLIDFIKTSVTNTLVENERDLDLNRDTVIKINSLLEKTISNAYINGVETVSSIVKE